MADSQKFLSSSRPARAAIYARVSTDMQTERFGLDLQLHECRRYAAQHGYDIVKEYVEGGGVHGVSGATTSREQTTTILSDLQQIPGMFTLLIIYDTARLARDDSGVFGRWYEDEVRKLGVAIAYVQGGYGNDPEGQLLKRIKQDFDTYERQRLAVRDRAGMAARARRGLWNGGFPPLGYDVEDNRFVLNAEETELVREIFRLYAEGGFTVGQIGERLYHLRIPGKWERLGTKHYKRRLSTWASSTLFRILTNPAYIGRAIWGIKKNPRPWMPNEQVEITVPRIIPDELWEQVQWRLEANRLHRRRDKSHPYLVSGLVRCQCCGRCLSAVTAQRSALSYYFCVRQAQRWKPYCENAVRYRVAEVDEAVWTVVVQGLATPAVLEELVARYLQTDTLPEALEEARLKRLHEEIAAVQQQADEVLRLGAVNALAQARAQGLLQELHARYTALVHERDELAGRLHAPYRPTQSWQDTLAHYRRWLQSSTWRDTALRPLPGPQGTELEDLEAPAPPLQLQPLLFALRQRIVRDLVESVIVSSDGAGWVYLRGSATGIPIAVTAVPPKMPNRHKRTEPAAEE